MTKMNFPDGTFVVVTTGEKAKTFRVRNGSLDHQGDWTPKDLIDDGPAGKSPPEMSEREIDEATFSKQIAQRLYKLAHQGAYSDLILAADPDTLGEIRPLLHQEVTSKLRLEKTKTLINSSTDEIEQSLSS